MTTALLGVVLFSLGANAALKTATLSNVLLPTDQYGAPLITGEASVMAHGGEFWFYFNDWGSCPGVDCCAAEAGCASCCFDSPPEPLRPCQNPYGLNHTVQSYRTSDFVTWENMGVALSLEFLYGTRLAWGSILAPSQHLENRTLNPSYGS